MRVVVLTQWFPPEKAALPADIAAGLAAAGHDVTVLTGFPNYPTGRIFEGWRQRPIVDERHAEYRVRRVCLYPSHDRSPVRRAANYLSFMLSSTLFGWSLLRRADVIYVYHPPLTAAIGPWLSRKLGGPAYVLHVQDLWPESVVQAGLLARRSATVAERVLTKTCDQIYAGASAIVAIAPTMAAMLEERGAPRSGVHVVPNWADETIFEPLEQGESSGNAVPDEGAFSVMFAGNMGDLQGLDVAIRAAAEVRDLPGFRLVLVGDGVARESLKMLAVELGVTNVFFVRPQDQSKMNVVTHAADVQLVCLRDLPFLRGTIPSKLGSVMASGLPVICSVGGDAADVVRSAGAGWPVAPESVEALASAFRQAHATTPAGRQELGRRARDYYQAHMSRASGVGHLADVLIRAARENPRTHHDRSRLRSG